MVICDVSEIFNSTVERLFVTVFVKIDFFYYERTLHMDTSTNDVLDRYSITFAFSTRCLSVRASIPYAEAVSRAVCAKQRTCLPGY